MTKTKQLRLFLIFQNCKDVLRKVLKNFIQLSQLSFWTYLLHFCPRRSTWQSQTQKKEVLSRVVLELSLNVQEDYISPLPLQAHPKSWILPTMSIRPKPPCISSVCISHCPYINSFNQERQSYLCNENGKQPFPSSVLKFSKTVLHQFPIHAQYM